MGKVAAAFLLIIMGLPAFAALIALAAAWRGYVLSILWGWFVVPGFGAQPISVPLAIGLSMLIGMVTNHRSMTEAQDPEKKWMPLWALTLGPLVVLDMGWVVKQFL